MYEFKIAYHYLRPRRKSLSTALISLLSVFVISLVVWLVVVFLSVTAGIEKNWLRKLTSLHAPVRLTPTDAYYQSYYYQVDRLAAASNYTVKTIGEKAAAPAADPYVEETDPEIPFYWSPPDRLPDGQLRDPVKIALRELESLQKEHSKEYSGLSFQDYEIAGALLRLNLHRPGDETPATLSQMSFLLSLTERNPRLRSLFVKPDKPDLNVDFRQEPPSPPSQAYFVNGACRLPQNGEEFSVLLPKNYRDSGALVGDTGTLSFVSPSAVSAQEQRIRIRVAGFYDPGILSMGNKCLIVPQEVTQAIHAASQTFSPDGTPTNGIFVWPQGDQALEQAPEIQREIAERFEKAGIASYWKIDTFRDFEFSKDLMLQFQSDRTLFLLIAAIILIVACCNIATLLVLLVNDKKREIAVLQSMGAPFRSIAAIFGTCGAAMGALSCLIGTGLALLTLRHLDSLVACLSALQGRAAFNPAFFGSTLPNQLSYEALLFALIATPLLSFAAGLIPAWKASRVRPAQALRSE